MSFGEKQKVFSECSDSKISCMLRGRYQNGVVMLGTCAMFECATDLLHVSFMRAVYLVYKAQKLNGASASVDLLNLNYGNCRREVGLSWLK